MNKRIQSILLHPHHTIKDAMKKMEEGKKIGPSAPWGICLIVDEKKKLKGVVTDGDIRQALLAGHTLSTPVSSIMTKNPLTVKSASLPKDMLIDLHHEFKNRNATENKYHQIVIVHENGAVEDVVTPFELWRRSELKTKNVAIIGLGYVGLTLGLSFADLGIKVFGIDTSAHVVKQLTKGVPHFYEKGLDALLKKHINKNLFVKKTLSKNESDIYIICVGTATDEKNNMISSYIKNAAHAVGKALKAHDLIVLRSTVVVGTTRDIVVPILEKESGLKAGRDFFIAFAPERTAQGKALEELRTLPQVIGGLNKQSLDYTAQLFQPLTNTIISVSSMEAAETVKLLNNTFRDISFSFSNEVAQICDRMNLNTMEIIRAANEGYPRNPIPYPSPGVGGSCLVKDPYIFAESAKKVNYKAQLPLVSRAINQHMVDFVHEKVHAFCKRNKKSAKHAKIFIVGMAFKGSPETSDIRNSTAVDITKKLQRTYKNIVAYDPVATSYDLKKLGIKIAPSLAAGFKNADCVLLLNNHHSYKNIDIHKATQAMNTPSLLLDGWSVFAPQDFAHFDHITYDGLGVGQLPQ
ncbi:MAG: nucleotide sugar dehydrogenase [Candidatus Niyogibacteria bacterium CG10_big_fil_rev_8_21_14_0_10_46_36]|uniref:Nucleotide sugar dehydrogenase n=1 Tax=Candidatus Niyogibacteria bacterium CG10_big_fil_rev_8_21_14_0_10_46_36 TaxID=1974726 RepID=A0A2H0TEJ3_9BACT|nr:MAG: nucleotide sugar dehydrogenase [Candidatus Niyogibacteria bacterium CG10_big_fil_rev_8_21_14_0_10_46_36]